jgi:HAD superfamily hydrolase (TIGR01509 family)
MAILFDLDGLLADTEKLQIEAYQKVFSKYGIPLSTEEYEDHWIRKGLGIIEYVEKNNIQINYEKLRVQKKLIYHELIETSLEQMPFAVQTVKRMYKKRKIAVASSSNTEAVRMVLEKLGIKNLFDVIVSGDQIVKQKPSPEIFLKTAQLLNTRPSDCIVIEDAEKGILAAQSAGMKSIAVPNKHTIRNNFKNATYIIKDLSGIEGIIEMIERAD